MNYPPPEDQNGLPSNQPNHSTFSNIDPSLSRPFLNECGLACLSEHIYEPLPLPRPQSQLEPPRFKIGDEVFILSTNNSDPTGLATYMVERDDEIDSEGVRHYRLVPLASATYRAAEHRLLEAGFPLGSEVRFIGDVVNAIIVKRYVVNRERLYDLKDEWNMSRASVKELQLQNAAGGNFSFVTPVAEGTGTGANKQGRGGRS